MSHNGIRCTFSHKLIFPRLFLRLFLSIPLSLSFPPDSTVSLFSLSLLSFLLTHSHPRLETKHSCFIFLFACSTHPHIKAKCDPAIGLHTYYINPPHTHTHHLYFRGGISPHYLHLSFVLSGFPLPSLGPVCSYLHSTYTHTHTLVCAHICPHKHAHTHTPIP